MLPSVLDLTGHCLWASHLPTPTEGQGELRQWIAVSPPLPMPTGQMKSL